MVLVVGSCPAQPLHQTAAGLLIRRTVTAGARTAFCDLPDSSTALYVSLYAVYIVCQKRRARTGAGPKKVREPGTGPVLTLVLMYNNSLWRSLQMQQVQGHRARLELVLNFLYFSIQVRTAPPVSVRVRASIGTTGLAAG